MNRHYFTGQPSNSLFRSAQTDTWTINEDLKKMELGRVSVVIAPSGSAEVNATIITDGPPQRHEMGGNSARTDG